MTTRRQFLTAAGALGATTVMAAPASATAQSAASGSAAVEPPAPGRPPNFVLILADDLGYGELGAFGQQIIQTPNLDQLAAEGLRCTDYYAGNGICAPSRCSLLTGLHTGHALVRDNSINRKPAEPQESLRVADTTFGQVLKAAGYTTGLFGKWGFGPDSQALGEPAQEYQAHHSWPLQKGFDEFLGFVHHHHATNGYYATYMWEGNERFEIPENAADQRGRYTPDFYLDRACDFIRRNRNRPFLLTLTSQLPHTPNHCPTTEPYADRPWPETTKKHAAMITRLDEHVGRVIATLRENGLHDNTIVFVTSDNGPHDETAGYGGDVSSEFVSPGVGSIADNQIFNSSGGLRGAKHNLYEGGIRVPMIVWGPGRLRAVAGRSSAMPWAAWDILPTMADYARVAAPPDVDGQSLRPLFERADERPHRYLYWERPVYATPTKDSLIADGGREVGYVQAARSGRYKALRFSYQDTPHGPLDPLAQVELYDLENDRGETRDIASLNPAKVAELVGYMDEAYAPPPMPRQPYAVTR